jgi:hypothetical protein
MLRAKAVASAMLLGVGCYATPSLAYRPFDGTDASVAAAKEWEIELGPAQYHHSDDGVSWLAPSLVVNYGISDRLEAVLEGQGEYFSYGHNQYSNLAASLKAIVQDGTLQEGTGVSLGTEFSVLLPGIRADNGAGLEWAGIASQRFDWGTIHLNAGGGITRDNNGFAFIGTIIEGPQGWVVRPIAEFRYERKSVGEGEIAVLIGLIYPVSKGVALDLAFRHGRVSGRPDEQIRAGVTLDLF